MVIQLVKKFSVFYVTPRFISAFKRAQHWSPSWARRILSTSYTLFLQDAF